MSKRVRYDESASSSSSEEGTSVTLENKRVESHHEKLKRLQPIDVPEQIESPLVTCTLPPGCNTRPRHFWDTATFEHHYTKYHCNVCHECHAKFPTSRYLDLHIQELHDPIWSVRLARGELVYGCFEERCPLTFASVSARRKHLIQVHDYPAEFRFNLVNKGITRHVKSLLFDAKSGQLKQQRPRRMANSASSTEPGSLHQMPPEISMEDDTMTKDVSLVENHRPPLTRLQRRAKAREAQQEADTDEMEDSERAETKYHESQNHEAAGTSETKSFKERPRRQKKDGKHQHALAVHTLFESLADPDKLEPENIDTEDDKMTDLADVLERSKLVPSVIKFGRKN